MSIISRSNQIARPLARFAPISCAFVVKSQQVSHVHNTAIGVNSMGQKVNRPISPHVTIYSQPIPGISSITNRVTGVMMTIGLFGAGSVAMINGCDLPSTIHAFKASVPALVPIAKIIVSFPLIYHFLAGLRHLYWDATAKMLDLPAAELSSKILIGSSIVLAFGSAFITLPAIQ